AFDQGVAYSPTIGAPPGAVAFAADPGLLPADATVVGELVTDVATARGATAVLVVARCVQPGEGLPPDAPLPAEVWEQTPLPRPVAHASPPGSVSCDTVSNTSLEVRRRSGGPACEPACMSASPVTRTRRGPGWNANARTV